MVEEQLRIRGPYQGTIGSWDLWAQGPGAGPDLRGPSVLGCFVSALGPLWHFLATSYTMNCGRLWVAVASYFGLGFSGSHWNSTSPVEGGSAATREPATKTGDNLVAADGPKELTAVKLGPLGMAILDNRLFWMHEREAEA